MTEDTAPTPSPAPIPRPHRRTRQEDGKDLIGWSSKNILLPLLPFLLGATIRSVESLGISFEVLDPTELAFSLSMFCLLGYVSAHFLEKSNQRDTVSTLFALGIFFFTAMFAVAIVHSTQLINMEEKTLSEFAAAITSGSTLDPDAIQKMTVQQETLKSKRNVVLIIVTIIGIPYLLLGLGFRHIYNLGDSK